MKKTQLAQDALRLTNERLVIAPDFPVLKSVKAQLEYILDSFRSGKKPTESEKDRVTLGTIAVREFENNDSEYADKLEKVSYLYKHPELDEI